MATTAMLRSRYGYASDCMWRWGVVTACNGLHGMCRMLFAGAAKLSVLERKCDPVTLALRPQWGPSLDLPLHCLSLKGLSPR